MNNNLLCSKANREVKDVCMVRLVTTSWANDRGLHFKRSLIFLKRKCKGYNILAEDCLISSAEEVAQRIINMQSVEDGIYQVVACNVNRDWETGIIDDYDYKLVSVD